MKKYDLVKFTDEIKAAFARRFRPGDAVIGGDKEDVTSFVTKEEALEALSWYRNSYTLYSGGAIGLFFDVEEFAIEENEYDDDGEFVSGGDVLATADASEWDVALNHDWLEKNKFALEIAQFDGTHFGEWMPLEEADGEWYDDVEDFLKTLAQNGFFDKDVADAATRDKYRYKVVATYACRDINEDWPMSWNELTELAGLDEK